MQSKYCNLLDTAHWGRVGTTGSTAGRLKLWRGFRIFFEYLKIDLCACPCLARRGEAWHGSPDTHAAPYMALRTISTSPPDPAEVCSGRLKVPSAFACDAACFPCSHTLHSASDHTRNEVSDSQPSISDMVAELEAFIVYGMRCSPTLLFSNTDSVRFTLALITA